jgi:hypothetical protein
VKVTVDRGALQVHDGIGPYRRTRRYERATHGLRRLVLTDPEGFVTFEALRWCRFGVVVLDNNGRPVLASTPRASDDARLRRAQALAPSEPVGLAIARYLLSAKVQAQAELVRRRFGEVSEAESIASLADALGAVESIEEARQLEASAAALYFGAWAGRVETAPTFAAKDRPRVPGHWSTFEGRRSVLASASANRKAERPVNALLNYVFALLEAEAILACAAVGLDPGLGIVHSDAKGRQSMALTCSNLCDQRQRASCSTCSARAPSARWSSPRRRGARYGYGRRLPTSSPAPCLVGAHALSRPGGREGGPHARQAMEGKYTPATPLTSAKLRSAQAIVKARKAEAVGRAVRDTAKQHPTPSTALPLYSCPECGGPVTNARHVLCEPCQAGAGHTAAVRQSRGRAIAARKRALKERVAAFGSDVDAAVYRELIWPKLGSVKFAEIMEATGYSKGYCSTIRAGKWTPHVSTWPALAELVGLTPATFSRVEPQ